MVWTWCSTIYDILLGLLDEYKNKTMIRFCWYIHCIADVGHTGPFCYVWKEGPITGYLVYYTNTTFSDTVKITGGDNRQYNLTKLTPYTNYTVTVIAYNDVGTGPASSKVIQQTGEASKLVTTGI